MGYIVLLEIYIHFCLNILEPTKPLLTMQVDKLEKLIPEVVQKLSKLKSGETLSEELTWCWGSFQNDNNPVGVIEKGQAALELLKEAREKNSKAVSKKLVESLEKALN